MLDIIDNRLAVDMLANWPRDGQLSGREVIWTMTARCDAFPNTSRVGYI